jgi:hypothetical protein
MSPEFREAEDKYSAQLDDLVRGDSSVFGRLVAICSLRNLNSPGRPGPVAAPWVEQAVRRLHQRFFALWLCLTLEEQKADLATYLWRIGAGPDTVAELVAGSMALAPEGSMDAERGLFAQTLAVLYTLFFREADPGNANPAAPALT